MSFTEGVLKKFERIRTLFAEVDYLYEIERETLERATGDGDYYPCYEIMYNPNALDGEGALELWASDRPAHTSEPKERILLIPGAYIDINEKHVKAIATAYIEGTKEERGNYSQIEKAAEVLGLAYLGNRTSPPSL